MSRLRIAALALLVLAACALTWQVQAWRHGRQVALREEAYARERQQLAENATAQLQDERQQRLALEQRLQAVDQTHYQELIDAQQTQARLRDRLATADLRLSVLLASDAVAPAVPAAAGTGSVVHDPARARLDPAHARRIVAIVDDGDQGLIALRACQAYVRALRF
ncbi:lysis system i-spanin subunit Rz [Pseudomonas sp. 148P]|uniref:Lysis system i-spanin subunit Rz n=1 Tax=Pseudomonas ulcerans TaxID=3115852 RepID=A0ABU7HVI4_9PSED|nr:MULTISPECIES: lysis system i-spanin subunit Rz [unclassified Pseudomonas]MEE1924277.1 lysis system i-spanin subunit Rz [Pseudomonas sp. 147P]MEE1935446.1 lysis system i-spanin subunit Rz [Pseudomonas sp. 148P]